MIHRRPSWSRSCLYQLQLSPLRASVARSDPPLTTRSTPSGSFLRSKLGSPVEHRRQFASVASTTFVPSVSHHGTSLLHKLLSAIARKDVAATTTAFYEWAEALGDEQSPHHAITVEELRSLPSPVLSEIIRSMDPLERASLDVAHGLNITQGETQFTDNGKYMDQFGIRVHHGKVLDGMLSILQLSDKRRYPLRPADFNVFQRCAGAAADWQAAPIMWGAMIRHHLQAHRTTSHWVDFIKSRFRLEPTYYQYDRARMVVEARSLVQHTDVMADDGHVVKRLERVRLSENAFKRGPWNRRPDQPDEDIRRLLRRSRSSSSSELPQGRSDYRSFWSHFLRQNAAPNVVSEELICASIMAFSRSSDRRAILDIFIKGFYDIDVNEDEGTVTGGKELAPNSIIYPTDRLLFSLVEAFGAMSEISLGMQLIDFISQRYSVPISSNVWSNLLQWTYLCASKKLSSTRKVYGGGFDTRISTQDVSHVWRIMTSAPYNIEPSFQDLDIYVRTLITRQHMDEAVTLIQESAIPFYDSLVQDFEDAVRNEILLKDSMVDPSQRDSTTISRATHCRREAETLKDHVRNRISSLFDNILRRSSNAKRLREGPFTAKVIPHLIATYPQFFQTGIHYRTSSGKVQFHKFQGMTPKDSKFSLRDTLPAKLGSVYVSEGSVDSAGQPRTLLDEAGQKYENPDFSWPMASSLRVLEKKRAPLRRPHNLEPPPPLYGTKNDGARTDRYAWLTAMEAQLRN